MKIYRLYVLLLSMLLVFSSGFAQRRMEKLDRGLVAVKVNSGVYLSWRVFGTDPEDVSFNIYRDGTKVNTSPITGATNMTDRAGTTASTYTVKSIINGEERGIGATAKVWGSQVKTLNLRRPAGLTMPDGGTCTYEPNDINVGDLDGDGQYELVVKWYPSNAKDNSQSGYTGNCYLDAYKLDGTFMWRIDLGINIRSGAHYTQHLVADFDQDGKAEVVCKTAPGTRDALGSHLKYGPAANDNNGADYRNSGGYILSGPEYLTIFNGQTGAEMATINYVVLRGNVGSWGDTYGNRLDRFNSTVAYLDGVHPSMVFQRGYYTRLVMAAFDWDGKTLSHRWTFDSNNADSRAAHGQGNHSIMAGDVDGDGRDEIFTGQAAIDDNGKLLWTTGFGHGDANHLGDFDPDNPGLEIFSVTEHKGSEPDHYLCEARTGKILVGQGSGTDNGRGMTGDIDASHRGSEIWSNHVDGTRDCKGGLVSTKKGSCNFRVYWDGDLQDELFSGNQIDKYDGGAFLPLQTLEGWSCNGTKATPNLSADILGDWREEVILHYEDQLLISTTTIPTDYKLYTLMHDPIYRNAISWQQSAYNQPPHLGFWLADFDNVPTPNIVVDNTDCNGDADGSAYYDDCAVCVGGNTGLEPCTSYGQAEDACEFDGTVDSNNGGYQGSGFVNFTNAVGSSISFNLMALEAGTYTFSIRYANGSAAARPMTLTAGANTATLNFAPTGSWTTWKLQEVTLTLGDLVTPVNISADDATGGPNLDLFIFPDENILLGSCIEDCTGLMGGTAVLDNCGECTGGTTGAQPCVQDCNGDWGGAASIDGCGVCSGGNTGLTACLGSLPGDGFCDADGVLEAIHKGHLGEGYVNLANNLGSSANWYMVSSKAQTASITIRYANGSGTARGMDVVVNGAVQDAIIGSATADWDVWTSETVSLQLTAGVNAIELVATDGGGGPNIDILIFNTEGLTAGSCDADCNGVVGGSAYIDNCNTCVGGNTGIEACEQDCNGDWGGTASIDECDVCSGGATGVDPCVIQTIQLRAGWNLIGCPLVGETAIAEALSGIWAKVEVVKSNTQYYNTSQDDMLNTLQYLEWGRGYFIKVNADCELEWAF